MQMKQYLLDTFLFNDITNKKLLEKIMILPDKTESIKLFSHLINCQYKWMARIQHDPLAPQMSWWEPVYDPDQLDSEWDKSLQPWLNYINDRTDDQLATEVTFTGLDGGIWGTLRHRI